MEGRAKKEGEAPEDHPYDFVQCDLPGCEIVTGLRRCARCHCVAYCSVEHQKEHWNKSSLSMHKHKLVCKNMKLIREEGHQSIESIRETYGLTVSKPVEETKVMWREYKGMEISQGITTVGSMMNPNLDNFRRLYDVQSDGHILEGPGHALTQMEFVLDCAHYDDSKWDRFLIKASLHFPAPPYLYLPNGGVYGKYNVPDAAEAYHRNGGGLLDYSAKPDSVEDTQDAYFDAKFPFPDDCGWLCESRLPHLYCDHATILQVRTGDAVKVCGVGPPVGPHAAEGQPWTLEKCWLRVENVTSFGWIAGSTLKGNDAFLPIFKPQKQPTGEDKFLSFPITCVIGVKHGPNWP